MLSLYKTMFWIYTKTDFINLNILCVSIKIYTIKFPQIKISKIFWFLYSRIRINVFSPLKHFLFWVNRFWRKGLLPSALLWCSQSFIQELDCFLGQSAAYFSWFLNAFTSLIDQRRSCWHVMSSTYIKCMKQAFKFY